MLQYTKRQVKYTMRNLFVMFVIAVCFLFLLKLCYYISGEEERSTRKGKISAQINPWRVVDFSQDIIVVQSFLGKSLNIACVISTILDTLVLGIV